MDSLEPIMQKSTPMPSSIKVGPYTYVVSQDEKWLRQVEHERSGGLRGATDHQALKIVVGPDMAIGMQRQTLWHEVKHCVIECSTMGNDERSDEDWIGRTAPMELAVLRDNPDLVAFLIGHES